MLHCTISVSLMQIKLAIILDHIHSYVYPGLSSATVLNHTVLFYSNGVLFNVSLRLQVHVQLHSHGILCIYYVYSFLFSFLVYAYIS